MSCFGPPEDILYASQVIFNKVWRDVQKNKETLARLNNPKLNDLQHKHLTKIYDHFKTVEDSVVHEFPVELPRREIGIIQDYKERPFVDRINHGKFITWTSTHTSDAPSPSALDNVTIRHNQEMYI